ncbi:MAG TPA: PQQ-binding-like beta-propeller repeat protein, partial [bacterium]|nr:PQQ-binding-like beta-propeller repeat protein [bacterium]
MKYLCSLAMTTIAFASVSFPVLVLASSWPQSFQNNQRNAYVGEFSYGDLIVPDKNITPTLPYTNFKMPISADGINYFFEESRTQEIWIAYAIERASNTEIWRTSGSGLINSTPVLSGKTLIIPSKKLVALNIENGETLWQFSDDANYRFWYPLVEGDKVYAIRRYSSGGSNGYIYSLELSSGVMNWRTYLSAYGVTELSYYNESLIATTSDTTNYTTIGRYSVLNGSLLWSSVRFSSNFTSPTVIDSDNGLGLYSNAGGVVNAINLSDGSLSYAAGNGTTATVPVLRDNKAYFLTLNKNKTWLNSFDYVTKSALQKWEVAPNSVTTYRTQPLYLAGKIWFPTINGELWRFDVVSNELEKFPVGKNNDYLTNLLIADDQIVLANQDLNKIWSMSS